MILKKTKAKKISCFVLALLMIGSILSQAPTYATTTTSSTTSQAEKERQQKKAEADAKVEELQQQVKEIKNQLTNKKTELADAKKKTDNMGYQLTLLNEQNALLTEEIYALEDKIEAVKAVIAQLSDEISDTEAEEAAQYDLFCKQVRQEEELGTISYWSVIFKATSFTDLLSRIDFINEIMEYDTLVMNKLMAIRENLKSQKEEQEAVEAQLEAEEAEKNAAQEELENQVDQANALLKEYKRSQEELQKEYDMIAAESAATESLLKEAQEIAKQLGLENQPATAGGYAWPLATVRGVTSHFGGRNSPGGIGSTNHKGTDFAAPMGTKVYAAKAGTVTWASWNGGYGNCVIIQHGGGNTTLYGHLSSISVKVGDVVAQGSLVGYSGNTGNSTGPHLHFGITENNTWIDPLTYLGGWVYVGS